MSTGISSIAIRLPFDEAFQTFGETLAERLGASALLYAAIAYYVFDDSFFVEDLIDHNPELAEPIVAWMEDLYCAFGNILYQLRVYYAKDTFHSESESTYQLLKVNYVSTDEDLYVSATCDPRYYHLENQWRVLSELDSRLTGQRHVVGRAI